MNLSRLSLILFVLGSIGWTVSTQMTIRRQERQIKILIEEMCDTDTCVEQLKGK